MKLFKNSILSLIAIGTTLGLNSNADADRYNTQVNYDLVIQHSHDLEAIAADLKDRFRNEFRHSRNYGKLISRAKRLYNRSHRLHSRGVARGTCNWQDEIRQIDELVYELGNFVNQAVDRSRAGYDARLCGNTVRTVRRLLRQAEFHAAGLQKSFYNVNVQRPRCGTTYDSPIINQPAPNFLPGNGIGQGVYRSGNFNRASQGSNLYRSFSNIGHDRKRFAVNVGGFKFYVNK